MDAFNSGVGGYTVRINYWDSCGAQAADLHRARQQRG